MKRIGQIYEKIYDFENLYLAYLEARKGKRYRPDVLEFGAHLEENLIEIQNELVWKTYQVGPYRQFYVHLPKKRLIMSLSFKDRVVQWAIYRQLNPIFDKQFIYDSYGCRKDKGTHAAANRLQSWMKTAESKPGQQCYYLKLDISKYFHRVNHEVLMDDLNRRIKDKDAVWLLGIIINNPDVPFGLPPGMKPEDCPIEDRLFDVGMPIGNLTSQLEANLCLDNLDQYVKHTLRVRHYIRYMDDMIILGTSKGELWLIKDRIEVFLNERLKLDLNEKTRVGRIKDGVEFVGLRIWSDHRKIKKQSLKRVNARLKYVRKARANGEITATDLLATEASYRGLLKSTGATGLLDVFKL